MLLFLLRSLVSMNFNVVYIYTAEVRPDSAGLGGGFYYNCITGGFCLCFLLIQISGNRWFLSLRCIPLRLGLWGWASVRHSVGSEEWSLRSSLRWVQCPVFQVFLPSRCDITVRVLQVLMSQSVILALSPFAVACVVCALGNFLLPIETKGRALLVRNTSLFTHCANFI